MTEKAPESGSNFQGLGVDRQTYIGAVCVRDLPDIFKGCKLFPCVAGDKVPATKEGWHIASDDPAQLAEWARILPGCNWAVATGPSGLFVIDVDPNGLDWWAKLLERDPEIRQAVDKAFQVRTPRGGLHVYFKGEGPSTASRIAGGIDTRGGIRRDGKIVSGGYVLLPGSRTSAGVYQALPGGEILPLPACVSAIVPERKKTDTLGLEKNPDADQPRNVAWAVDLLKNYVASGRVSIEGRGGNNTAFQVAASILDKAISPGMCYDLMAEHWNPHCTPMWDEWELEQLIRNAAEYGEDTGGGVKGFQANEDAFAAFAGMEIEEPKRNRKRFEPMFLADARKDRKPAKWLIPDLLPAEGTGILYGLSGSYKTFVALDWALCLAHGIGGQWGAPPVKHTVVYFAGESSYALRQERVDSWCEKHNLDPDDTDVRFVFVHGVPGYNDKEGWTEVRDGLEQLKVKPDLIVIDTLTREMTGLDENSNNDAKLVLKHNEEMADHYGCMVLAIGHTGKDQSKGMRGAQVFVDNSDAVLFLKKTATGVLLKPQKLKETDIDDTLIYLEVEKQFGKSITLGKTDKIPDDAKGKEQSSRYAWAQVDEVLKVLESLKGETSDSVLHMTIAGMYGIDRDLVKKQLDKNTSLVFLRPERGKWVIPKMEYDL